MVFVVVSSLVKFAPSAAGESNTKPTRLVERDLKSALNPSTASLEFPFMQKRANKQTQRQRTYPQVNVHIKHREHGKESPDDHGAGPAVQVYNTTKFWDKNNRSAVA